MRGAERPAKVRWTRPFLPPLGPLEHAAAQQTFIDIADDGHNPQEVRQLLALADNMPLAISLLASAAELDGCSNVLSRWEVERTSLISEGYDRKSNLDLSISISLSSPRVKSIPHSKELLSLLAMLPDGLSDVDLVQAKIPITDILTCKAALVQTALAYIDERKILKVLVPIRHYMQSHYEAGNHLIQPLLQYFTWLLEIYGAHRLSGTAVTRISSNYSNIQSILHNGLKPGHPDLKKSIYCTCHLNSFSRLTGQGTISLLNRIWEVLPEPCDHRLETYFISELFSSWRQNPISDPETLMNKALAHLQYYDDTDLKCGCH